MTIGSTNFRVIQPEQVAAAFREHAGVGPCPDAKAVAPMAHYLTLAGPFGIHHAENVRKARLRRSEFSKTTDGQVRQAIWTLIEQLPGIIKFREERLDDPTGGMFASVGILASSSPDHPAVREQMESKINELRELLEMAHRVRRTFLPPPRKRKRESEWHETAQFIGPMVAGLLRYAGRNRVSLKKPDAPAVRVTIWALSMLGFENVENDALAQMFKRKAGTNDPT